MDSLLLYVILAGMIIFILMPFLVSGYFAIYSHKNTFLGFEKIILKDGMELRKTPKWYLGFAIIIFFTLAIAIAEEMRNTNSANPLMDSFLIVGLLILCWKISERIVFYNKETKIE